jgi:hypothetical protein
MSGIFRGSEQEVAERTLAAERRIEIVEADLANLRVHRRVLTRRLAREGRARWLPELKGLLFGGALVVLLPFGLLVVGVVVCTLSFLLR